MWCLSHNVPPCCHLLSPWLFSQRYHDFSVSVSGSNLATHIVGSLKKGKSLTPIPPTTYNTLPSSHALSGHRTISEGMISASPNLSLPPNNNHKRSPSSDSGNPGSRSTTPVSYHLSSLGSKLHGELVFSITTSLSGFPLISTFVNNWICKTSQETCPGEKYFHYFDGIKKLFGCKLILRVLFAKFIVSVWGPLCLLKDSTYHVK